MKQPVMPSTPASETPDLWDAYWEQVRLYDIHLKNLRHKDYRDNYYKKRTEQRQMKKMEELMLKFPDQARQVYAEHLQSK